MAKKKKKITMQGFFFMIPSSLSYGLPSGGGLCVAHVVIDEGVAVTVAILQLDGILL